MIWPIVVAALQPFLGEALPQGRGNSFCGQDDGENNDQQQ